MSNVVYNSTRTIKSDITFYILEKLDIRLKSTDGHKLFKQNQLQYSATQKELTK